MVTASYEMELRPVVVLTHLAPIQHLIPFCHDRHGVDGYQSGGYGVWLQGLQVVFGERHGRVRVVPQRERADQPIAVVVWRHSGVDNHARPTLLMGNVSRVKPTKAGTHHCGVACRPVGCDRLDQGNGLKGGWGELGTREVHLRVALAHPLVHLPRFGRLR